MSASLQEKKELTLVCRSDIVFCDAGDDVVLPCHLQPSISAASMEIKWFNRANHICHYKDGDVRESIDDLYKGRVNLSLPDLHNGNVSLTLKDVRAEHRGIFICEVIHEHQTVKEYIFLHVRSGKLTLVASPTIFAELGENTILPVFLSPVTSAVSMEIKWYRETELIYLYKYGQETVFVNQVDSSAQQLEGGNLSITLRNFQQSDSGDYTCVIFYDGIMETANINLRMRVRNESFLERSGLSRHGSTNSGLFYDSLHRRRNSMERILPLMRNESFTGLSGQSRHGSTNSGLFNDSLHRRRNSMERIIPLMRNESFTGLSGQSRHGSTNSGLFNDSLHRRRNSMERIPPVMSNESFLGLSGQSRHGSVHSRAFYAGYESSKENDEIEHAGNIYYDLQNLDPLKRRQSNEECFKRQATFLAAALSQFQRSTELGISAAKMTQPQKNPGSTMQHFQEMRPKSIAPEQELSSFDVQSQVSQREAIISPLETAEAAAAAAAEIQTQEKAPIKKPRRRKSLRKNCQIM